MKFFLFLISFVFIFNYTQIFSAPFAGAGADGAPFWQKFVKPKAPAPWEKLVKVKTTPAPPPWAKYIKTQPPPTQPPVPSWAKMMAQQPPPPWGYGGAYPPPYPPPPPYSPWNPYGMPLPDPFGAAPYPSSWNPYAPSDPSYWQTDLNTSDDSDSDEPPPPPPPKKKAKTALKKSKKPVKDWARGTTSLNESLESMDEELTTQKTLAVEVSQLAVLLKNLFEPITTTTPLTVVTSSLQVDEVEAEAGENDGDSDKSVAILRSFLQSLINKLPKV